MSRLDLCAAIIVLSSVVPAARSEVAPDPNRGVYAIWTKPGVGDNLPFIKGGQVLLRWKWVQPEEGRYDFSRLHEQLEKVARQGRVTTVQLNANNLPAFLFEKVPHTRTRPLRVQDSRGTLQYWHPYYIKAYTDLIAQFAKEVKSDPHASCVMGVRLSYDAIGTEWMTILPEAGYHSALQVRSCYGQTDSLLSVTEQSGERPCARRQLHEFRQYPQRH
jgi:hypothetical protein